MSNRWQLLDSIQDQLDCAAKLPRGVFNGIAQRLDESIAGASRAPLDVLHTQLSELLDRLLKLEPTAAQAIQGNPTDNTAFAAYIIGQASFAQLLAAQAAERRVDDDFQDHLSNSLYKAYVNALMKQDLNGKELAKICDEAPETVSRKLKQLRELGITEFRREGTSFVNFLTPAARSIVKEVNQYQTNTPSFEKEKRIRLIVNNVPTSMQSSMSLSPIPKKATFK